MYISTNMVFINDKYQSLISLLSAWNTMFPSRIVLDDQHATYLRCIPPMSPCFARIELTSHLRGGNRNQHCGVHTSQTFRRFSVATIPFTDNDDIIPVDQPVSFGRCNEISMLWVTAFASTVRNNHSRYSVCKATQGQQFKDDCQVARVMTIIIRDSAIVYPTRRTSKGGIKRKRRENQPTLKASSRLIGAMIQMWCTIVILL